MFLHGNLLTKMFQVVTGVQCAWKGFFKYFCLVLNATFASNFQVVWVQPNQVIRFRRKVGCSPHQSLHYSADYLTDSRLTSRAHNLPQPTQAEVMTGEFPATLWFEQGVVLACMFAESKVQWTSRVLWMAVMSQWSASQVGSKTQAPVWGATISL